MEISAFPSLADAKKVMRKVIEYAEAVHARACRSPFFVTEKVVVMLTKGKRGAENDINFGFPLFSRLRSSI